MYQIRRGSGSAGGLPASGDGHGVGAGEGGGAHPVPSLSGPHREAAGAATGRRGQAMTHCAGGRRNRSNAGLSGGMSWQLTASDVIAFAINVVQNGQDCREPRPDRHTCWAARQRSRGAAVRAETGRHPMPSARCWKSSTGRSFEPAAWEPRNAGRTELDRQVASLRRSRLRLRWAARCDPTHRPPPEPPLAYVLAALLAPSSGR